MEGPHTFIFFFSKYIDVIAPIVALIIATFRAYAFGRLRPMRLAEQLHQQLLFWVVGFQSLFVFMIHVWHPEISTEIAGWPATPLLFQMAMVNLSFGILGFLSTFSSLGFKTATTLGYAIWIFGDGTGHLFNILTNKVDDRNIGLLLYTDMAVPLILVMLLMLVYQNYKSKI